MKGSFPFSFRLLSLPNKQIAVSFVVIKMLPPEILTQSLHDTASSQFVFVGVYLLHPYQRADRTPLQLVLTA